MVYALLMVWTYLAAMGCFGVKWKSQSNRKLYLILVFGLAAFIMGLRSTSVGVDTGSYESYYHLLQSVSWKQIFTENAKLYLDPGYCLLMKLCSLFSSSYYFFQIVYAIVYATLTINFIQKMCNNVFVGTMVFLGANNYLLSFNIQRQCLATMIMINSYLFFKEKKRWRTIVLFAIAIMIHQSSVICVVLHICYSLKNNRRFIRCFPIALLAAIIGFRVVMSFMVQYFPRYKRYYVNTRTIQSAGGIWFIWIIIVILFLYINYVCYRKNVKFKFGIMDTVEKLNTELRIISCFSLLYVSCNIIGLSFNYFERIGVYFMPFLPVLFERFGAQIHNIQIRVIYYGGVLLGFTAYFLRCACTMRAIEYSTFLFL